ncbi:reticulophagy regulator 3 isoform X2 [Macaca nemestrina]|uniref:Reticulophagy regulator family member 3 n=1 Tax=Macaca mulatta TaxID=9544 RepID=A0A1D5R964_MACMU|nr:reticulophagy regulator 3 isoform X2 [Macaca fascicularis]XP_011723387.1 reticulophagy regulator 3 isoform X2 [Macaca nemestrina]XP_014975191.1 reticulophagy regulator 3 isoform X1 [Macaca mulatta]
MAEAEGVAATPGPASGSTFRGRRDVSGSWERDQQVEAAQRALVEVLGPYEPLLSRVQAALVWERPARSALWCLGLNAAFWFFALTSLRLVFLLAFGLMIIVCIDQWKNKIWPEIKVPRPDALDNESWGFVHPRLLSVPELCHHVAEVWVSGTIFIRNVLLFKKQNPGKFCLLSCGILTFLAVLGRYVPGLLLSYFMLRRRALHPERAMDNHSDSEEELAAFCPQLDDSTVARELAITDSEHSDAEVSCTDNGTFNLSRGQTPLTEGSEDLDGHSDPEESFARDLPDFPSINVDPAGLDDEDDTSIGMPSLMYRSPPGAEEPQAPPASRDEAALPELLLGALPVGSNLTSNLASLVSQSMIQLALSGASQPGPSGAPAQRATRGFLRSPSSDLDTDAEGDDFELLDQSELNQLDPASSRSH